MKTKIAGIVLLIVTVGISAVLLFLKGAYFHDRGPPPPTFSASEVADAEYPFMAYIITQPVNTNNTQCGGTLIASNLVLTAAQCVVKFVPGTQVWIGRTVRSDATQGYVRTATQRVYWNSLLDMAVLKLDKEVTGVVPIAMPDNDTEYRKPGNYFITTGWGRMPDGKYPDRLHQVEVPYVSHGIDCRGSTWEAFLCAGGEVGKDACIGDSGGPLFVKIERGRFLQVGMVSAGHGCGITADPGFYVDLSNEKVARIISEIISAQKLATASNTWFFRGEQNHVLLNDELSKVTTLPVYRF
ncbi:S1 family peptidase [Pseudomonas fluorescens]|uniref:Peptidase S1 domain-containing protein n=1 Tax=Pseudomonas fluorescens TaxID=294 RepID=A0A5E7DIF4_PSEFL|nr:serine protease [Pseudomonas fluorescens]VVO11645.1 hypothetical protein PS691_03454 [Pseudomonas fluorescens]